MHHELGENELFIPKNMKNYSNVAGYLPTSKPEKNEKSNKSTNSNNNENLGIYPFHHKKTNVESEKATIKNTQNSLNFIKSYKINKKFNIDRQNRYDNYETNKTKPHVFNSKSPDYLRLKTHLSCLLFPFILTSIYNTLSKNSKNTNDNDFKNKINYFSITEREKIPKENETQQNNSFFQNTDNTSKNNSSIKTNIYQTNNLSNINAKISNSGFIYLIK